MYLEASATAGNFTRAAKSLGINTSTDEPSGRTLRRRTRHRSLRTRACGRPPDPGGKAVLPHIRRALAELDCDQAYRRANWQWPCRRSPSGCAHAAGRRAAARPSGGLASTASPRHADHIRDERAGDPDGNTRAARRCRPDDAAYAVARCRDRTDLSRAVARGATARPPARPAQNLNWDALQKGDLPRPSWDNTVRP